MCHRRPKSSREIIKQPVAHRFRGARLRPALCRLRALREAVTEQKCQFPYYLSSPLPEPSGVCGRLSVAPCKSNRFPAQGQDVKRVHPRSERGIV